MTQDEIIEMAIQAELNLYVHDLTEKQYIEVVKTFAKLIAAKALAQPKQKPVAWIELQKEAQQIVESKSLWKKFIDDTPLANDIACWMTDFALQHTHLAQRTWVGLTRMELIKCGVLPYGMSYELYQAIEAKLKERNT